MIKNLDKLTQLSNAQIIFGKKLNLDFAECTTGVAIAKIWDLIDHEFWENDLGGPTSKQIDLAAQFGYNISNETKAVGSAIIDDIMMQLNLESIDNQHLQKGDIVINKWQTANLKYIISSIKEDGTVFFKGGNGHKAWARNLIKINK